MKWFGYSRRERRSVFVLLIIILLIIALRHLVPERTVSVEDITGITNDVGRFNASHPENEELHNMRPLHFDPNNATYETLVELGLSEKQSKTLLNYRNKGGRFRKPSDISKIYGIGESTAEKLTPFIIIEEDTVSYVQKDASSHTRQMIDLNTCDSTMLDRLPGIGPVLSARIIKYRNLLGGFAAKDQLKEVYGLSEETYNLITDRVFADSMDVKLININKSQFKDFARHPYFERYDIQSILKYRAVKGRVTDITELTDNKIITRSKAKKIKPYLVF